MGRAGRWLKGVLGMKKEEKHGNGNVNDGDDGFKSASFSSFDNPAKERDPRRSFITGPRLSHSAETATERSKRESAAVATVKVADVVFTPARAAVLIRRLTAGGSRVGTRFRGHGLDKSLAAVRIQSVFRGFLARKALNALKGIVKLQALIRGCLVRKDAMVAALTRRALGKDCVVAGYRCACRSFDKENAVYSGNLPRQSIERIGKTSSSFHSKRYTSWDRIEGGILDTSLKSVEIIAARPPHIRLLKSDPKDPRDFGLRRPSTARGSSISRGHVNSSEPVSPARSAHGESTACKKHVCREYPNYMASTRSFDAKSRSMSESKKWQSDYYEGLRRRPALREITSARNSIAGVDTLRSFSHYEHFMF
ncbi:hypothetical protein MLD38_028920 [Melastoma candidum]|uniref:Uncharacterized protein n=1 Tax=Melastoma candidum TaxID=119954 RepID=A0ACB9N2H8_9MYRT|nr:hypothetical protein MLD38_028920 [Melastoma candidum]